MPVSPEQFAGSCCSLRPLTATLELTGAPSLVDLVRGFLDLRGGRAPGRSKLPAEVFTSNPVTAALAYGPVTLKLLARGVNPIQWSGGTAFSIPKGTKDPGTVQGWRAILLLESDAKAFQKAWRPFLMEALEPIRTAGQHGGVPAHTLDQPSALVRAHFQGLCASGASGGALFVDCASAYYAIVRDFYFAGPYHAWTSEELLQRSKLFFSEVSDQQAFLQEMQAGNWLQALRLPDALHRVVMAQLQDTWYIDGSPGTTLYATNTGTAPGSPVADALFAFLFSRFLSGMEAYLRESGVSPHVTIRCAHNSGAEAPAWADDVVVLFTVRRPEEVPPVLAAIGAQAVVRLRALGLTANLGAGKTEAVVSIRGRGSRSVRRDLLAAADPCVALPERGDDTPPLRVVPSYVHLGTTLGAELSESPNLKRRAKLLFAAFKPIKNKLLRNPFLLFHEKRELILSRVVPVFMHGSGLWRLATRHEQEEVYGPLNSVLRQCVRPLTGKGASLLTQSEVLAALDMPSVQELLNVSQVRALAYVLREDMRPCWTGFLADGHWLQQACQAARLVFPSTQLTALLQDGVPSCLDGLAAHFLGHGQTLHGACRRYLKHCRGQRPPVDWDGVLRRQEQADDVQVTACSDPRLCHVCQECGASFLTHRRLCVHLARKHRHFARGRRVVHGTCCEVCSVQFWTVERLASHLERSDVCQRVYEGADFDPESFTCAHVPAWRPSAKLLGPKPFWATLRP